MPLPSANKRKFNLSIHGSRTLKDERVKIIILEEIKKYRPTTIQRIRLGVRSNRQGSTSLDRATSRSCIRTH